jgi:hypothetical protein
VPILPRDAPLLTTIINNNNNNNNASDTLRLRPTTVRKSKTFLVELSSRYERFTTNILLYYIYNKVGTLDELFERATRLVCIGTRTQAAGWQVRRR